MSPFRSSLVFLGGGDGSSGQRVSFSLIHVGSGFAAYVLFFQRGATETQNGYGIGMLPGYVPHDELVSDSASHLKNVALLASFSQHLSLKLARHGAHA